MSGATSIQWTDVTWNPTRGCSRVSEGCRNCYAERQAIRQAGPSGAYEGLVSTTTKSATNPAKTSHHEPRWTGKIRLVPEALEEPIRWRKPRRVFVDSMSDLFHEEVPNEFIDRVFAVMALAPDHTFQVLTKRPDRMRAYFEAGDLYDRVLRAAAPIRSARPRLMALPISNPARFPLRNLHLGVSVENQEAADERIPLLLQTPAAVRFLSVEPLLGPMDLNDRRDWLTPVITKPKGAPRVDWVIVGGESGPGARPCDVAWIRSVVDQCRTAGVPCFVKQLGARPFERADVMRGDPLTFDGWTRIHMPNGATWWQRHSKLVDRKGGDPAEWPEDLRVREYPA